MLLSHCSSSSHHTCAHVTSHRNPCFNVTITDPQRDTHWPWMDLPTWSLAVTCLSGQRVDRQEGSDGYFQHLGKCQQNHQVTQHFRTPLLLLFCAGGRTRLEAACPWRERGKGGQGGTWVSVTPSLFLPPWWADGPGPGWTGQKLEGAPPGPTGIVVDLGESGLHREGQSKWTAAGLQGQYPSA